jgi:hypothetical protein
MALIPHFNISTPSNGSGFFPTASLRVQICHSEADCEMEILESLKKSLPSVPNHPDCVVFSHVNSFHLVIKFDSVLPHEQRKISQGDVIVFEAGSKIWNRELFDQEFKIIKKMAQGKPIVVFCYHDLFHEEKERKNFETLNGCFILSASCDELKALFLKACLYEILLGTDPCLDRGRLMHQVKQLYYGACIHAGSKQKNGADQLFSQLFKWGTLFFSEFQEPIVQISYMKPTSESFQTHFMLTTLREESPGACLLNQILFLRRDPKRYLKGSAKDLVDQVKQKISRQRLRMKNQWGSNSLRIILVSVPVEGFDAFMDAQMINRISNELESGFLHIPLHAEDGTATWEMNDWLQFFTLLEPRNC